MSPELVLASCAEVRCSAVPCCAVLCCAVLCRAVPCCAVLCCNRFSVTSNQLRMFLVQDGATAEALQAICSHNMTVFAKHAAALNMSKSCHLAGMMSTIPND